MTKGSSTGLPFFFWGTCNRSYTAAARAGEAGVTIFAR